MKNKEDAMEKARQYKLQKQERKRLKKLGIEKQAYSLMKVKDARKYVYEAYAQIIFSKLDIDQFLKQELEQKAIVIIDELDKIVRTNDAGTSSKASDEGV